MTLRVSGKNLDIGEALRQHVLEKVEATVARYFTGSVGGHVVMTREGSGYRSDCTLRLSSGISLHAEGRAQEPYRCFDQAEGACQRLSRACAGQGRQLSYRIAVGGIGRTLRRLRSGRCGGRNRGPQ